MHEKFCSLTNQILKNFEVKFQLNLKYSFKASPSEEVSSTSWGLLEVLSLAGTTPLLPTMAGATRAHPTRPRRTLELPTPPFTVPTPQLFPDPTPPLFPDPTPPLSPEPTLPLSPLRSLRTREPPTTVETEGTTSKDRGQVEERAD